MAASEHTPLPDILPDLRSPDSFLDMEIGQLNAFLWQHTILPLASHFAALISWTLKCEQGSPTGLAPDTTARCLNARFLDLLPQ
jgi:hypothetical protein